MLLPLLSRLHSLHTWVCSDCRYCDQSVSDWGTQRCSRGGAQCAGVLGTSVSTPFEVAIQQQGFVIKEQQPGVRAELRNSQMVPTCRKCCMAMLALVRTYSHHLDKRSRLLDLRG
jgi:hypothetical protein